MRQIFLQSKNSLCLSLILLSLFLFSACSNHKSSKSHFESRSPINKSDDLLFNPTLLTKPDFHFTNAQLMGLKIGSKGNQIIKGQIEKENEFGWKILKNGARFRVDGQFIKELAISPPITYSLNIQSIDDIVKLFGKPDSQTELFESLNVLVYKKKGLFIHYHDQFKIVIMAVADPAFKSY